MHTTEILTLIATLLTSGWLAMFIAQAIKRPAWPSSVKLALAVAVSILVGLAAAWISGDVTKITLQWGNLTAQEVLGFGAIVYATSATWYHHYFDGTTWMAALAKWPGGTATAKPDGK